MKTCNCPPGSPFHWQDTRSGIDWSRVAASATISAISSHTVESKRSQGIDVAAIHGLSKKTSPHYPVPRSVVLPPVKRRARP